MIGVFFKMKEAGKDETIFIGLLHAFKYANCTTVKDKTFKFDSINLLEKPDLAKQLEVLST